MNQSILLIEISFYIDVLTDGRIGELVNSLAKMKGT